MQANFGTQEGTPWVMGIRSQLAPGAHGPLVADGGQEQMGIQEPKGNQEPMCTQESMGIRS